jgi:hypothetical protein
MIKITLNDTLPSWNKFYSGMHWAKRKQMADYWHELVKWEIIKNKIKKTESRKAISITCYFPNRRSQLDADNLCAKLIIDGLKNFVMPDDNDKYIGEVCLQSRVDKGNPRTEIIITNY